MSGLNFRGRERSSEENPSDPWKDPSDLLADPLDSGLTDQTSEQTHLTLCRPIRPREDPLDLWADPSILRADTGNMTKLPDEDPFHIMSSEL